MPPLSPVLDALREPLTRSLYSAPSTGDLFNPYRDVHPDLDRPDAAAVRRANLEAYLSAYRRLPDALLLAEAPGPWGCRFSGVPITSEAQLRDPRFVLSGTVSSIDGAPHTEYSANVFWRALEPHFPRFFVWNSVPLHPHDPGDPLSIRTPRASELRRFEPLTAAVVHALQPRLVLAIGRKAEQVLRRIGIEATYVRHPSQGGATEFARGIAEAFGDPAAAGDGTAHLHG